jgi:4-amino-4-deoxy-L-arabinose transferase-like glycosyltransferase
VVVLTCALALVVYAWARRASGPVGGLVALALVAFHPSLLAHGHLATTDVPAALWMLVASWACWRWCRIPCPTRATVLGLAFGAAVATRFSAWLLLPVLLGLAATSRQGSVRDVPGTTRRALAVLLLSLTVLPAAVVWTSYGLRREPWPGVVGLGPIAPRLGVSGVLLGAIHSARLLPDAYLEGIRYQLEHAREGHPSYLLGEHADTGWLHYYVVAFALKNTPGFLIAMTVGAIAGWCGRGRRSPALIHWSAPAATVFATASVSPLQIGERYVLPMYPYLILICASALPPLARTRRGRGLLALLLLLHAGPALAAARSGYLPYRNALAGSVPPLLDSNLDWGQDLPRLAEWMRRNDVPRVRLAYHGADDPDRFGIVHDDLPGAHLYPAHPPDGRADTPVVVSPNLLFGLLPRLREAYAPLRHRRPDARAGVFYVFRGPALVSTAGAGP